jgi:membrane-associated phospholipid phosphatase
VGIALLARARATLGWRILEIAHDWSVAPLVFFSFKELYFMITPIHGGVDRDDWLILADRWLFGVDPTVWLAQYAHPVVTEVLQIAYTTFYFLFLLIGFELYFRRPRGAFHFFMFTCTYGFYLSYLGYLIVPGVGPRFTLHDFSLLDAELPGVFLTPYLRAFVNWGESIPAHATNAVAMAAAQRDVFPSGHTMLMLVMILIAVRYNLASRHFIIINGTLLIIATVYQRYHYVIDLVGGAVFAWFCLWTAPRLYDYTRNVFQTIDRYYSWRPGVTHDTPSPPP